MIARVTLSSSRNAVSFSSAVTMKRFRRGADQPIQTVLPWGPRLLEQPEEFEDDHDNDNHSNYVKDVSAHAGDSYQIARAMVNIYPN